MTSRFGITAPQHTAVSLEVACKDCIAEIHHLPRYSKGNVKMRNKVAQFVSNRRGNLGSTGKTEEKGEGTNYGSGADGTKIESECADVADKHLLHLLLRRLRHG